MKAFLGQWVRETKTGAIGKVYNKHYNARQAGADDTWLALQTNPFSNSEQALTWYGILCKGGGAVITSESRVELVAPDEPLNNKSEFFYFGEAPDNDQETT